MHLEEKGYSRINGRADEAPAVTRFWDRVPPEERAGPWTVLPPWERERLLGRQPRVHSRGSPSHIRRPLSDSDCVICPLEEVSSHQRPRDERGESPGRTSGRSSKNWKAAGEGIRTIAGEGRPWRETQHRARESPPGEGRAGGGREKAVAESWSGPKTCRSEGRTGRGKDPRKRWPTLPKIGAGEAPCTWTGIPSGGRRVGRTR